ncbi:MAG: SDR family oxidoreductase [Gemmataceae bacterium]
MRHLREQRIIITGASGGIGRALAEMLAARGSRLALAARSLDKLDELARSLQARGAEVIAVPTDVTIAADRQRLFEVTAEQFGGVDILVNNAGIASFGHFAGSSEAILRQIMEVNFFAPAELSRLAIPYLTKGRQPALVNVSSMCGRKGLPAWPEYSASKHALVGLTEALRGEMTRFEIDVLLILPGLTKSDLGSHLLRNEGRMKIDFAGGMAPAKVAAGIVKALEKNRTETVIGSDAKWMLRVQRFFPGLVDRILARKVRQLYLTGSAMEIRAPKSKGFAPGPRLYEPPSITEQANSIGGGRKLS